MTFWRVEDFFFGRLPLQISRRAGIHTNQLMSRNRHRPHATKNQACFLSKKTSYIIYRVPRKTFTRTREDSNNNLCLQQRSTGKNVRFFRYQAFKEAWLPAVACVQEKPGTPENPGTSDCRPPAPASSQSDPVSISLPHPAARCAFRPSRRVSATQQWWPSSESLLESHRC